MTGPPGRVGGYLEHVGPWPSRFLLVALGVRGSHRVAAHPVEIGTRQKNDDPGTGPGRRPDDGSAAFAGEGARPRTGPGGSAMSVAASKSHTAFGWLDVRAIFRSPFTAPATTPSVHSLDPQGLPPAPHRIHRGIVRANGRGRYLVPVAPPTVRFGARRPVARGLCLGRRQCTRGRFRRRP